MKAAVIRKFGDFDVLKVEDVATPKPRPEHVLIKILAAGVNRLDHYIREGSIVPELPFPHILGADAAGEIAEIGEGVSGFSVGERVIPAAGYATDPKDQGIVPPSLAPSFALPGLHIAGTYAQFIEIPAKFVIKDETGLSPEASATLPVALATAVRSIKEVGRVKSGNKVLIQAGASGSGSMQIQIAKALGAQVATTVRSDAKGVFAREIGADLVINAKKDDFVASVKDWTGGKGVDVVIDNLGGDTFSKSIEATRPHGVIVAFGFAAGPQVTFDIRTLFFGMKQIRGSMASTADDLRWGLEQVKAGHVKPLLDRTFDLSEAAEAHRLIAENRVRGNVVLLPWAA